jgi:hypothetical protein
MWTQLFSIHDTLVAEVPDLDCGALFEDQRVSPLLAMSDSKLWTRYLSLAQGKLPSYDRRVGLQEPC